MASALSARTLAPSSLVQRSSLTGVNGLSARGVTSLARRSNRLAVSASQEGQQVTESVQSENGVQLTAAGLAASFFATLAASPSAHAAQVVAELAEDNRPLVLLGLLVPALGWVLFNIGKPALNQVLKMTSEAESRTPAPKATAKSKATTKRKLFGAAGLLAAGLVASDSAQAAQEVMYLAEDNRPLVLLGLLAPALGWVLFNIGKPAFNQVSKMLSEADSRSPVKAKTTIKKKKLFGIAGLTAAGLLASDSAYAAQEVMSLAEDNRPLVLLGLLVPALGWVLFNIGKPALNQISKMSSEAEGRAPAPKAKSTTKRTAKLFGIAGLAAAGLMTSEPALAAQEVMSLAEDNRPLVLLGLLVPALGWVLFNIGKPALNQLTKMSSEAESRSPAPKGKSTRGKK